MTDAAQREALAALLREIGGNCMWLTWDCELTSGELARMLQEHGVRVLAPGEVVTRGPCPNCGWQKAGE